MFLNCFSRRIWLNLSQAEKDRLTAARPGEIKTAVHNAKSLWISERKPIEYAFVRDAEATVVKRLGDEHKRLAQEKNKAAEGA